MNLNLNVIKYVFFHIFCVIYPLNAFVFEHMKFLLK